jgi:hypothetical protein
LARTAGCVATSRISRFPKICGKSILEEAFPDLVLEIPDLGIPEFVEKFQNYILKKQLKDNSRIYMGVKNSFKNKIIRS